MTGQRQAVQYAETLGDARGEAGRGAALFPRNANRSALLIQNNSATAHLYVSFTGPATPLSLRIGPGGSFSETQNAPANAVWVMAFESCPFYAFEG